MVRPGTVSYEANLARMRARTAALKTAGGAEWEEWKREQREKKAAARARNGRQDYDKGGRRSTIRSRQGFKLAAIRRKAKQSGLEFSIKWEDLEWPDICPVLGIRLNYEGEGLKKPLPLFGDLPQDAPRVTPTRSHRNAASIDRWDNSRGYVPGNVYVISHWANMLKRDATPAELRAVANYAEKGLRKNERLL